jgi:fused signal recognition particle receptor
MIALWIVLAVVVLVAIVASSVVLSRRASARGATRSSPTATSTTPPSTHRAPAPPETRPREPTPPTTETAGPPSSPAAPPDIAAPPEVTAPPDVAAPRDVTGEDVVAPADLRDRMGKTRGVFSGYLKSLRGRGSVDAQTWDDLEEALLRADVGVATTTALLDDLRARVRSGDLRGPDAVVSALREAMKESLQVAGGVDLVFEDGVTNVWLFVGVNGVGKTTTIGKIARRQTAEGRSLLLAAGDTFRAAAAEQLSIWADRAHVGLVRGAEGSDPSAVVFDAVQRASARGQELVLADTAGRLHTKVNLVEELKKIRRVADRPPGRVTEVLLVLDATTGQNGLTQARQFLDAVGVTGVVLTKLDGTAKGGIVVAIQREFGLPVKLVGIGEGPDDLVAFDADRFVDALFD